MGLPVPTRQTIVTIGLLCLQKPVKPLTPTLPFPTHQTDWSCPASGWQEDLTQMPLSRKYGLPSCPTRHIYGMSWSLSHRQQKWHYNSKSHHHKQNNTQFRPLLHSVIDSGLEFISRWCLTSSFNSKWDLHIPYYSQSSGRVKHMNCIQSL